MNRFPILFLVAAFAAPLHAQVCSGGAGGGIDATGNECSDAATIAAYPNGSDVALPLPSAKMSAIQPVPAAVVVTLRPTKMSGSPATSTVPAQGTSRIAKAAVPPSAPVKTSKIETAVTSSCSGGAQGGMDATGNQCGEDPSAGTTTVLAVVAKR